MLETGLAVLLIFLFSSALLPQIFDRGEEGSPILRLIWPPVYLLTLILIGVRPMPVLGLLARAWPLMLLAALPLVSASWSLDPGLSLRRGLGVVMPALFGLWMASRYSWRDLIRLLALSFAILAVGSLLMSVLMPSYGVMSEIHPGAWSGLWFEKNRLGGVMALAALAGMAAAFTTPHRREVRYWGALVILAVALAMMPVLGGAARLRFSRPWLHLLRGCLLGASIQLGFNTIAHVPLATATALFFTAPIFATILSGPVNGEKVGPRRIGAAAAGFLGAVIILRPFDAAPDPAMLAALGSSLVFALALALSRGVAQADGAWPAFVSSVAATCLIALPAAAPVWTWPEGWALWTAIAATALFGAVRGMADLESYRIGEAGVVGVISYLRLAALGLIGWIWFAETPDAPTLIGAAVIVAAALHIARRERLAKRRAARAAAAGTEAEADVGAGGGPAATALPGAGRIPGDAPEK